MKNAVSSVENDTTDTVTLFDRSNYQGTCIKLDSGASLHDLAGGFFPNDRLASVGFGSSCGAQIILYENAFYNRPRPDCSGFGCFAEVATCIAGGPTCPAGTTSGSRLGVSTSGALASQYPNPAGEPGTAIADLNTVNFNDKASSLLMPHGGIAAVYSDANYQGRCQTIGGFDGSPQELIGANPTTEFVDNLQGSTVGNDTISSVVLLRGCANNIHLFTGQLGGGDVFTTTSDIVDATPGKLIDTSGNVLNATAYQSLSSSLVDTYLNIYSGPYFSGTCTTLTPNSSAIPTFLHDTTIGSVHVASGPCPPQNDVYLFSGTDYGGTSLSLAASSPDLSTAQPPFKDLAASLINGHREPISVYTGTNDSGNCLDVAAASGVSDLGNTIVGSQSIASVAFGPCPAEPEVRLYFASGSLALTQDAPDLAAIGHDDATLRVSNYSSQTISLYRDADYQHACQNVPAGETINSLAGSIVGTDTVSSVKLSGPCPARLELFSAIDYGGKLATLGQDAPDLATLHFAKVTASLVNNSSAVIAVYSIANDHGRCQTIQPGEAISDLTNREIGIDQIAAVQFGVACKPIVLLYANAHYGGAFLGLGADTADLATDRFARAASSLANNTTHTISVYSGANYSGRCQNVPAGTGVGTLVGSVVHNNAIVAVKVSGPCPAAVVLYREASFLGASLMVTVSNFDLASAGFANATVSLVNNTTGPIAVYSLADYTGTCQALEPGQAIANLGAMGNIVGPRMIQAVLLNAGC